MLSLNDLVPNTPIKALAHKFYHIISPIARNALLVGSRATLSATRRHGYPFWIVFEKLLS
jgi:hypothetical protein